MKKNEAEREYERLVSKLEAALRDNDEETAKCTYERVNEMIRSRELFKHVDYPFAVVLCDVLAELIRENEEIGCDEIAARYKEWLFEVLPVASKQAGCNLRYIGITE